MADRTRGLFGKFRVSRVDGSDEPGGKHEGADYFVLDLTHDPHAPAAIRAYAESCERDGYELLARDLRERLMPPGTTWPEMGMHGARCGDCREWLQVVRPGKYQCDNPNCPSPPLGAGDSEKE
ncbi:MAG: hypothetical protein NXI30_04620 [bacterium]|nr:hypothetical protein [bacterium]